MKKKDLVQKYNNMSVVSKATIWFMLCSFVNKGLSFITTPIFTRLLSPNQYGLYSVYTSWLQILLILATFRLDYSVFNKGMSQYPDDRDGYTSSMLGVTTIITTILFVFYLLFHNQINTITELSTVLMCALFVELYVSAAVNFWSLRERYEFHYKAVVAYTLLSSVFSSGISILAVLISEDKGTARIVSGVLVHAVGGIILYYLIFKRGKKVFSKDYAKFAIVFNIPLMPHYFSTYMIEQADRIMIQKLVHLEAAALYSVAYTVGGLAKIFTAALTNTLIPMQYRYLENKDYKSLNKMILGVMFSVVCVLLCIAFAGPEIILILGGKEYIQAFNVIPPVAASVYFSFLYILLANMELFFSENKFVMKLSILGAVVNVVLNFLAIPTFGFVAAAYTTLVSYIIFAIGHMLYTNYLLKTQGAEGLLNYMAMVLMGVFSIVGCVLIGFLYDSFVIRAILGLIILLVVVWKRRILIDFFKK